MSLANERKFGGQKYYLGYNNVTKSKADSALSDYHKRGYNVRVIKKSAGKYDVWYGGKGLKTSGLH